MVLYECNMQMRFFGNIALRKSVSVFLVSALLLSHIVYFFTKETYALTQRTWSTAEDFNAGTLVDTVVPGGIFHLLRILRRVVLWLRRRVMIFCGASLHTTHLQ